MDFKVSEKCNKCGLCVDDCPSMIIEMLDGGLPSIRADKEKLCVQCQHCLAVCPTGAVSIFGRKPEDSITLKPGMFPDVESMSTFIRGRRSIRRYKDENVDRVLLKQILAAVSNAPSGVNARQLTFNVIDDKDVMKAIRDKVHAALDKAGADGKIPESALYLKNAVPMFRDSGRDLLFRGAPHALIVTTPFKKPCPAEDVIISLSYFELLAQSASLGTVWWGMLKMLLETLPELKPLFGVKPGQAYYAMLFGNPSVRHARTVQRDEAAQVRRVTI